MSDKNKINYYWVILRNIREKAMTAAFFLCSIFIIVSMLKEEPYVVHEMPVLTIYCNELDFKNEIERKKALLDVDNPISRCQELMTWKGNDIQAIRGLAAEKSLKILNSLLSHTKGADIARAEITNILEYFIEETDAYKEFSYHAREMLLLVNNGIKTSFDIEDSFVRVVSGNYSEPNWVANYKGTWIQSNEDKTTAKNFEITFVFSAVNGELRNSIKQAIIVTDIEVSIED